MRSMSPSSVGLAMLYQGTLPMKYDLGEEEEGCVTLTVLSIVSGTH